MFCRHRGDNCVLVHKMKSLLVFFLVPFPGALAQLSW